MRRLLQLGRTQLPMYPWATSPASQAARGPRRHCGQDSSTESTRQAPNIVTEGAALGRHRAPALGSAAKALPPPAGAAASPGALAWVPQSRHGEWGSDVMCPCLGFPALQATPKEGSKAAEFQDCAEEVAGTVGEGRPPVGGGRGRRVRQSARHGGRQPDGSGRRGGGGGPSGTVS